MASVSLLAELETAVKNGTSEKRLETLRRVTSLFLDESNRLNEQQIGVFDDVLVHLIQRIETKALMQLSTSLAPVDNAPIEVIHHLSRNDEVAVAGPVLSQSKRLSESDLVEIVTQKSQSHMLAISTRETLPEAVTDVLVERGNGEVHRTLAQNSGARFSELGYASLVKKSASDEKLAEKLGLRLDIPFDLLRQLLTRASNLVRSRILAAASPENRDQIQRAFVTIVNEVGREATGARDFVPAEGVVGDLNRQGKLTEAVLSGFAKNRQYEEMAATLALFCGVKSELIERLLKNVGHDGVLVACKAAKLSWHTTALVLRARFAHHAVSEQELLEAKDSFLALSQASAQRSIRFMQVQHAAKRGG